GGPTMLDQPPPPADDAVARLHDTLKQRLGSPGKWEHLFLRDGRLVHGAVERIEVPPGFANPTLTAADKPRSAFVPYEATIPAVHDWDVLETFRQCNLWDRVPRFPLAGERTHYALNPTRLTAGILVAGGPAAGLNMVIDSIVKRHFSLATLTVGHKRLHQVRVAGYLGGYVGLKKRDRVWLAPS